MDAGRIHEGRLPAGATLGISQRCFGNDKQVVGSFGHENVVRGPRALGWMNGRRQPRPRI
jgi:hypothetical protein